MNQRAFDADLNAGAESDWKNPEDGYGWRNNPMAKLFDNPARLRDKVRDEDEQDEEE